MIALRVLRYAWLQLLRHRLRTLLALGGIAVAMFLWTVIRSAERGVAAATELTALDTRLVVYRQNRYCPFTSQLPQRYESTIARVPGVSSVAPIKIVVSNCRASLDVVTFRGVTDTWLLGDLAPRVTMIDGSSDAWASRGDGALVGEELAHRRRVRVGDTFRSAGITVVVSGIFSSDEAQDRNSAFVHLPFLQEQARRGGSGGIVTQFTVNVDDPARLEEIASAIDKEFLHDEFPTNTTPEKHFVARAAQDVVHLAGFASWVGLAALVAVFALVANALVLAMQARVRESAVLEVLGYTGPLLAWMTLAEGVGMSLAGGTIGAGGAWLALSVLRPTFSAEGASIEILPSTSVLLAGLVASAAVGLLAAAAPALRAARMEAAQALRAG